MTRSVIEFVIGQSTVHERIKEYHMNDPQLVKHQEVVLAGAANDFIIFEVDMLRYKDWICVSMDACIKNEILD